MKKYILIFAVFFLTACSAQNTDSSEMEVVSEVSDSVVDTPTETIEVITVEGESMAFSPYTSTAKVTIEGDDVVDVVFDELLEDGTSKVEASQSGEYTSANYTQGEYFEQMAKLEKYVIENDQFPTLSEGKDVDGTSGASVNLSGLEEAYNNALNKV